METPDQTAARKAIENVRLGVRAFVRRMIACRHDADDVTQEALARFLSAHSPLTLHERFPLLVGIARRVAFDLYRMKKRDGRRVAVERTFVRALTDASLSPEDAVEKELMREKLLEALATLPEPHQRLLCAMKSDGMTFKQAAAALGLPFSKAQTMRAEAYDQLAALLQVPPSTEDQHD